MEQENRFRLIHQYTSEDGKMGKSKGMEKWLFQTVKNMKVNLETG